MVIMSAIVKHKFIMVNHGKIYFSYRRSFSLLLTYGIHVFLAEFILLKQIIESVKCAQLSRLSLMINPAHFTITKKV